MTAPHDSQQRNDTATAGPSSTTTPRQKSHQPQNTNPTEANSDPRPRAAVLAEHVRAIVDSFPPLTPDQRDRIATLLRTIS